MNKVTRDQNTRNNLIDLLHSISKKVNKITRNIEADLPLDLEELNNIRILTSKAEFLDKTKTFKQTPYNIT